MQQVVVFGTAQAVHLDLVDVAGTESLEFQAHGFTVGQQFGGGDLVWLNFHYRAAVGMVIEVGEVLDVEGGSFQVRRGDRFREFYVKSIRSSPDRVHLEGRLPGPLQPLERKFLAPR